MEEVWEEPGDKWRCSLTFNFLTRDEFRILDAHLASLRGHVGITMIPDTAHQNAALQSTGLVCDEEGQYGTSLKVAGATPGELVANAGDRFQVGNQLFKVTEDTTADCTGRTVFKVMPEIRNPVTLNQPIITHNTRGAFRIENPSSLPNRSGNKKIVRGIQIDFIEAMNI
ncbi:hypothetical protein IDSA_04140 [Pseudidiomarina salinarum]|uniref:Uncharacterized protein n=1 Tax=Pseudidiomarina salinarum TaxID=435908 RepID=A0A094JH68_9GAMM|nr:hypothetical protein [Pseudidiomarina salinarum]KFZ31881.1 hypothetical protein IDSA_04140 [Pseudidiomarina salinarum]RUO70345.1 hypothetical protein CWI79_02445 [Pseudidiomarina salinarum]